MDFINYLQSQGKSQSTIKHYNTYILDFLSYLDRDNTEVENATAKEVLSYLNVLQKRGQENQTRNIRLNVIKQYFNWQIDRGTRADNPISHLKIRGTKHKKLYPILSKQELEQIYTKYEVPTEKHKKSKCNWFTSYKLSKQRNKSILSLLINQALTTAEVSRIDFNDLKLREGEIYIKGTRNSNERSLKLKSNQIMDLMDYNYQVRPELLNYQENPNTTQLFLSVPSAGQSKATESLQIWKGLSKEVKSNNPKLINFKQVRTSVITLWLKQYNLRQVQYMAGHRYVSSTESYLVNQTEDLQKDIDQFHPF